MYFFTSKQYKIRRNYHVHIYERFNGYAIFTDFIRAGATVLQFLPEKLLLYRSNLSLAKSYGLAGVRNGG